MQSVDMSDLDKLSRDLDALLKEMPSKRRGLHERIGQTIKTEVDGQIATSGINDSRGRIKAWQTANVGDKGGYAAVRARKGTVGANSPGAITNYLENGHHIRGPLGKSKQYRPRVKKAYVDGFHFYKAARSASESKAIEEAERFVDELKQALEG